MSLFILVEFMKGKSLAVVSTEDVVNKSQHDINIGDMVVVRWNGRHFYEANVLDKEDNCDILERKIKSLLAKPGLKPKSTVSLPSKRKIKKEKQQSILSSDEDSTSNTEAFSSKSKVHKSKTTAPFEAKEVENVINGISDESITDDDPQTSVQLNKATNEISPQFENEYLKTENIRLKMENEQLKKDRDEALETSRLLQIAKTIVENLQNRSFPSSNASQMQSSNNTMDSLHEIIPESEQERPLRRWNSSNKDVIELVRGNKTYLPNRCLQNILCTSRTCTQMARNLAKTVFTDSALETCSVFGQSKGLFGTQNEIRPALDGDAIKDIISFTLEYGKKQMWSDSHAHIVHSLNSMLSSYRKKDKM